MLHRRHRLAARFLAIGLLAATLYAVHSLAFPDPAEARCAGNGNPVRSTLIYNGTVRASETPVDGTCNGSNVYTGILRDERADGNCVEILFWDEASYWTGPTDHGTTCYGGNEGRFQWTDRNNNSRVCVQLCIQNPDTGFWACGWGTCVGDPGNTLCYGVNYGY